MVAWNMELDTLRSDLGAHASSATAHCRGVGLVRGTGCCLLVCSSGMLLLSALAAVCVTHFRASVSARATVLFAPNCISALHTASPLLLSSAGLLGFPSKDLQHRFLSTFKPVFYIRQRDYSKVRVRCVRQPGRVRHVCCCCPRLFVLSCSLCLCTCCCGGVWPVVWECRCCVARQLLKYHTLSCL